MSTRVSRFSQEYINEMLLEEFQQIMRKQSGECVESACRFTEKSLRPAISVLVAAASPRVPTPPLKSRNTFQHKGSHKYHLMPLAAVVAIAWWPVSFVF